MEEERRLLGAEARNRHGSERRSSAAAWRNPDITVLVSAPQNRPMRSGGS